MADRSRSTYRFFTYPDQRRRSVPEQIPSATTIYRRGAIVFDCGFEDAAITTHWGAVGGPVLDSTVAGRTGTNAARIDVTADTTLRNLVTSLGAARSVTVLSLRFMVSALPAATARLFTLSGTSFYNPTIILYNDGTLGYSNGGTAPDGPVIVPNRWYRIDLATDGLNKLGKWSVDGVAQTDPGPAANVDTHGDLYLGKSNGIDSGAFSYYFDDVAVSTAWADYPIGPGSVQTPYAPTVLPDSPVAYWQLGEASGNPQDSSGNAHHVTVVGGTPTYGQTGPVAGTTAVAFDGSTEYFTAPAGIDVADVFTLEAWVIPGATGASRGIICLSDGQYLRILNTGALTLSQESVGILSTSTIVVPAGGWHHVVATKNGATVKLYIDGVDRTGTVTNQTHVSFAGTAHIGQAGSGVERFNGSIGQAAVYDTALSATQVLAHYASAEAWFQSFTADAVLVAGGGTVSGSFTANAVIKRTQTGSFTANAVIKRTWGGARYSSLIGAHGPVAYWRLGEPSGTTATAAVGPNGTYQNTPTLGVAGLLTGDPNTAVTFDPASAEAVGISTGMPAGSSVGASVEMWLNTAASLPAFEIWTLWSRGDIAGPNHTFRYRRWDDATTSLFWLFWDGSTAQSVYSVTWATHTAGLAGRHHIAMVHDYAGQTVKAYVDGVLAGTGSASAFGTPVAPAANASSRIAGYMGNDVFMFPGTMDEVAVYDSILSATQILAHYQSGAGTSSSFTADAVFAAGLATVSGSFTANAAKKATISGSLTANAVIKATLAGSFTANAVKKSTVAGSFTANAALRKTISGTFLADAVKRSTVVGSLTANAVIRKTISGSLAADAVIKRTQTGSTTANAVKRATVSGSTTANAVLFKATQPGTFTADASKVRTTTGTFAADAAKLKTISGSFTANATLRKTIAGSFVADAVKRATVSGSFTANGAIKRTQTSSFTANAAIKATLSGSTTANAVKFRANQLGSLTADAVKRQTFSGSWTADATLKRTQAGSVTANAVVFRAQTGSFTANTRIMPVFAADAIIRRTQTGSFAGSAVIMPVFRADAVIKVAQAGSFTAGSFVAGVGFAAIGADAIRFRRGPDYSAEVLADTPVAYWPLGEASGNPQDSTANGHNVTVVNGTPTYGVTGPVSGTTAVAFNGTTDSFTAPNDPGFDVGDVFTLEAWVIPGPFVGSRGVLCLGGGQYLRIINTGELTLSWASVGIIVRSTILMPTTGWHHIVATKSGSTVKLYIDGVDRTGTVTDLTFGSFAGVLHIAEGNGGVERFNGSIGQVALYGSALSPVRVLAHYVVGTTAPGALTADAVKLKAASGSFTAQAVTRVTIASSFTASAVVKRTATATFSADAVFIRARAGSFTADAIRRRTQTGAFTGDAIRRSTTTGSIAASAVLRKTILPTFTVDSVVLKARTGTFAANAVVLKVQVATVAADAVLKATRTSSFSMAAIIARAGSGSFAADAYILSPTAGANTFFADAIVKASRAGSFTASANLVKSLTGSLTANAVKFKAQSGTFAVDATLRKTASGTFTADATKLKTIAGSFTANAWKIRVVSSSRTADAVIRRTQAGSLVADAVIRRSQAGSFTADARRAQTATGSFTASALVRLSQFGTLPISAVLRGPRSASFTADAWITKIVSASFTASAWTVATRTAGFATAATIRRQQTQTFTADAVRRASRAGVTTADATTRRTASASITADASIAGAGQNSFKVDAVKRESFEGSLTADAFFDDGKRAGDFTADAVFDVLRPSFPLTSTLTVAKMTAQIDAPHLGSSLSVERLSSIIVAPHLSASVGSVHLQSWLGWSRTTGSFTASAVIA